MFKIKNIEIESGASLAPMAGVTDRAFREICKSYMANFVVSEMVSSKALVMGDKKTPLLLENSNETRPFGIQLFGDNPFTMALSTKVIENYNPDFIDINAGCPAPKITNNGGGSSLMKNPKLIGEIVSEIVKTTSKPVTIKIRKGFDENYLTAVEVAKIAEENGASMITVHGRTREQMYAPPVDIDIIKAVKEAVSIPVIGNGDVDSVEKYIEMVNITGADGVMIGRGALGNPWIFRDIRHYLETGEILPQPDLAYRMEVMRNHMELMCRYKGEYVAMKEARKHCGWYMKGVSGASELRRICGTLSKIEDVDMLIEKVFQNQK